MLPAPQSRNSIPPSLFHPRIRVRFPNRFSNFYCLCPSLSSTWLMQELSFINICIRSLKYLLNAYYVPSTTPDMSFWAEKTNWERYDHATLLFKTHLLLTACKIKMQFLSMVYKTLQNVVPEKLPSLASITTSVPLHTPRHTSYSTDCSTQSFPTLAKLSCLDFLAWPVAFVLNSLPTPHF